MYALTICQPYAELIACGAKLVENRRWRLRYRGRLAIHAGKSRAWMEPGDERRYPDMRFGAIIATARVIGCWSIGEIGRGELPASLEWVPRHAHTEGPYCIVLAGVQRLSIAISCPGQRALWKVPTDVAALVRARRR